MAKFIKVLGIIAGVFALLVLLGWAAWSWFYRQALPKTSGTVRLEGLQQPVEIVRDEYGVPHIYAHTPEDLFFAQGYVHAQERFWQMEFQRRVASGRLSEIFGETTLSTDRYIRQFNFRNSTEQAYQMLDPESKHVVDAYAGGVNAYIEDRSPAKLGLEFAFLGLQGVKFEIEPWSPIDSMVWAYMMVYDQSDKLRTELANINQLAAVGQEMYADLNPAYRDDRPTIIQSEDLPATIKTGAAHYQPFTSTELEGLADLGRSLQMVEVAQPLSSLGFGGAGASNSFAVSGKLTETGKPILGNDPHMSVQMPAIWYQVGLHCVEKSPECVYNLRGFSLAGIPGLLIGHNDRIAWGLTNANFDAEDVFIERINPANPNQYEVNGKWVDMELRREEIKVLGQDEPVVIIVRNTRNGVVATDEMIDQQIFSYSDKGPQPLALTYAWPGLQPTQTFRSMMMFNRAQNWDEFVKALAYFDVGKQNLMYADVDGNIGFYMPGKVPIRAKGDGSLPVPGWTDEYRWTGFIPFDQLPHVFNPKQGYIAAPNNLQIRTADYPYLLSTNHDRGQRAARIAELIESDPDKISLEDLQAIQTDNQTIAGLEYFPYLKDLVFADPQIAAARDALLEWDGQMLMDSPQAVLFALFWNHLMDETFNDQLPDGHQLDGDNRTEDVVYFLLQDPDNEWWDRVATADVKERRDAVLKIAFEEAYQEGVDAYGENLGEWRWGDLHTIYFENATLGKSGISLIENLFNRGPFPVHGSTTVVQKTCWSKESDFTVYCIPALRQVVDLGDLTNTREIHSVGQSGHPASSHYDDFIELWRNFEYISSNWLRSQAEATKHDTLTLQPR